MALAVVSRLTLAGWRVPADLSVVGYDDADIAPYASPPLTSVHVPIAAASDSACRHVLNLCYGLDLPVQRAPGCAVVWRQSVGAGPQPPLGPAPHALPAAELGTDTRSEYRAAAAPAASRPRPSDLTPDSAALPL